MLRTSCTMRRTWRTVRRTATASNSARQGQLGADADVWREEPAMKSFGRKCGPTALSIKGKEGNRRLGAPFQNLQRSMAGEDTMAAKGR